MADSKIAFPPISPSTSLFLTRAWIDAVENAARHSVPNGLLDGLIPLVNRPLYDALPNTPVWGPDPEINGPYPALGNADQKKTWSAEKQIYNAHSSHCQERGAGAVGFIFPVPRSYSCASSACPPPARREERKPLSASGSP
jgi:hypothetical protein